MKKDYKTKAVLRLYITLMLMAALLLGCSSTEAETETAQTPEVELAASEAAEAEEAGEEAPVEETKPEETETTEAETEATEEEQLAEEETPISEEPVEYMEVESHDTLTDYIDSLDPNQAEIIIYNGTELYMIHMKEGQHYDLKANDEIIFNVSGSIIGIGWNFELGDTLSEIENYHIFQADYSKFEQNQEFYLQRLLDNGEEVKRTCYFTPPTE